MSTEQFNRSVANRIVELHKELDFDTEVFSLEFTPEIKLIVNTVLQREALKEENAAYGGSYHDSARSINALNYFLHGLMHKNYGSYPEEYEMIVAADRRQKDPEYQAYLKLKAKFEGSAK